jgi:pimeloyl-ACP methyl ester carboxylesterase
VDANGEAQMTQPLPIVLVPGLLCSPRLYGEQLAALWQLGPVLIADHTRDDSMAAISGRILATAPSRFALAGLSMGGYIAFEIMRQAAARVAKLALLDTSARADTPEQSQRRRALIALARSGRFADVPDLLFPILVHRAHQGDAALRRLVRLMAEETGPEAFARQETAIITRADSRPGLAAIGCPTLVLVGDGDELTPPELSTEIAAGISGARLVVVPDCGHLATIEQPRQVTLALAEWLRA